MKAPPDSTKHSLTVRLNDHARTRWPELARVDIRFRTTFAYIDGRYPDGTVTKLCRLRYGGSAHLWGFAIYRASHDDYEESLLPSGTMSAPPKKPSTAPAASTSTTQQRGNRYTYELTRGTTSRSSGRPLARSCVLVSMHWHMSRRF
jgi:hypothetical protein